MIPNRHSLLISIILLIPLSKYLTHASNSQLDSEFNKQRGIFNKYGSTWPDLASIDDSSSDDSDTKINPELRLLEELARIRSSAVNKDSEAAPFESERDVDSSFIPRGIQNMYDPTGRIPRSRNRHKSTFQSLCPSKRETIYLNLDPDYEYRPDYYDEIQCANGNVRSENKVQSAVCSEAGFSCIQLNGTLFLTRRARGSGCWESETRTVAAGCECMWPKHQLGDIMAHH